MRGARRSRLSVWRMAEIYWSMDCSGTFCQIKTSSAWNSSAHRDVKVHFSNGHVHSFSFGNRLTQYNLHRWINNVGMCPRGIVEVVFLLLWYLCEMITDCTEVGPGSSSAPRYWERHQGRPWSACRGLIISSLSEQLTVTQIRNHNRAGNRLRSCFWSLIWFNIQGSKTDVTG